MTELSEKARWANEVIGPASAILGHAGRRLIDLPTDVTPGARQVAQLTAWRSAQSYAIGPIGAALEELQQLPTWEGGFLIADTLDFDWRTAPFKRYKSFEDFYHEELEETWGAWDQLQETYRKLITGDIDDQQAETEVKLSQQANAMKLAREEGISVVSQHGGRRNKQADKKEIISLHGTNASYRVARLKRDHPDIIVRLAAGEFKSVSAAERAAGVVKYEKLTKLEKALNRIIAAWSEASYDERRACQKAILKLDALIEKPI